MIDDLLQEMIDPAPAPRDKPRRRRMWATVAIVGLSVVGATSLTTSALFTDNDTVQAGIMSGTVDVTSGIGTFDFPAEGLAPGGATVAPITVSNDGSLALRYAVRYSAVAGTPGTTTPDLETPAAAGSLQDALSSLSLYAARRVPPAPRAGHRRRGRRPPMPRYDRRLRAGGHRPALLGDVGARARRPATARSPPSPPRRCACGSTSTPAAGNEYQNTATDITLRFVAEQTVNN